MSVTANKLPTLWASRGLVLCDMTTVTDAEQVALWAAGGLKLWPVVLSPSAAAMTSLKDMLAASGYFQDEIGASGTEVERITYAKTKIYLTAYEADTFARPFGLICKVGNDRNKRAGTSRFEVSGDLELRLESDVPVGYADDPAAAEAAFVEFYENVIIDINALGSTAGYLIVQAIDVLEGPVQVEADDGSYYNGIRLIVSWGMS